MDGNLSATIRLVADTAAIGEAVSATHRFIMGHRLTDDLAARLAIVVEEIVTNLIEHGEAPGARVNLRLARYGDGVIISLTDCGKAFNPHDSVASDPPFERGGGAGVRLVVAWTTLRAYRRAGCVNRLQLYLAGQ